MCHQSYCEGGPGAGATGIHGSLSPRPENGQPSSFIGSHCLEWPLRWVSWTLGVRYVYSTLLSHACIKQHSEQDVLPGMWRKNEQSQEMEKTITLPQGTNLGTKKREVLRIMDAFIPVGYVDLWSQNPPFTPPPNILLKPGFVASYASYFPPLGIRT